MKRVLREPKYPQITLWIFVVGFISLPFLVIWGNILLNKQPPSPLPLPPEQIDKLIGIETGTGFWVTDPVVVSVNGNEFIYLDSLTDEYWESIYQHEELRNDQCESKFVRLFEKNAGDIVICMKASSVGEWCPGPIGYYAQSSSGIIWSYKKELPCIIGTLPIVLLIGTFILIVAFIVSITNNKQKRVKDIEPAYR